MLLTIDHWRGSQSYYDGYLLLSIPTEISKISSGAIFFTWVAQLTPNNEHDVTHNY